MTIDGDKIASAKAWLAKDPDETTKEQLSRLIEEKDEAALEQAFGSRLAFGTAGLRGVMGVGPNNMNRLLIREATAGLGNYIKSSKPSCANPKAVVIAYDGRHGSRDFAHDAAGVLAALGLEARLYDREAPTPLGAYAVKKLEAAAGIVVTASHNPPEFNGYKVYQAGGTQINTPVDGYIADAIGKVAAADEGPECLSLDEAEKRGLLTFLDSRKMFDEYASDMVAFFAPPKEEAAQREEVRIAYTPMHGVGAPVADLILEKAGFPQVWTVSQQRKPDGDFPTVKFPNPEEEGAMDLVHALADEHDCQIAIANDPDADRLSVSARTKDGSIKQLSGDDIGIILADELLKRSADELSNGDGSKKQKQKRWTLNTIVSSRLLAVLTESYGASHQETLTGFKWLGAVAKKVEDEDEKFICAYEEALGYMVTPLVWDKDGLSALLLLSLLAASLQASGETLWTRLESIRIRIGLSVTFPRTIRLSPGVNGGDLMKRLRSDLPSQIAGVDVALVDDLLSPSPPSDGVASLPKNDVVRFYFSTSPSSASLSKRDQMLTLPRIIIRPSGTEPKVKIYCESRIEKLKEGEVYEEKMEELRKELEKLADGFMEHCK